jgi:hypothetical protein
MKNCLVMGFGRSGTSLMGGLLYHSGYFLGNHLHPARETNPKGFFEDVIINRINEQILEPFDYQKLHDDFPVYPKPFSPYSPRRGHHWLAYIEPGTSIHCQDENILNQIKTVIGLKQPFAFKDPRFNYTLPAWLPYLPDDTRFICMFRNPAAVISSVIKECNSVDYLKDFYIDEELGYKVWYNFYSHLLKSLTPELHSRMIFIDYEDLIAGKCTDRIAAFLDAGLNCDFIEPELNRSRSESSYPVYIRELFLELSTQ